MPLNTCTAALKPEALWSRFGPQKSCRGAITRSDIHIDTCEIFIGDFNLLITDLVEGGIVNEKHVPAFDSNIATTVSGANRRCIDHAIVPRGLLDSVITANRVFHIWRPHLGLHLVIKKAFKKAKLPQFESPKRLPHWPNDDPLVIFGVQ